MGEDKRGNVTEENLRNALNSLVGNGNIEVENLDDIFEVAFINSKRYYEVDKDGNVSDYKKIVYDKDAGDITKGGTLDGTEEKPYQINCIEDLVEFSIMTNGGNTELRISPSYLQNKYIILVRTLDFKSKYSYSDSSTKKYGDLNKDGTIEDIRTELTKTEEGCIGFTGMGQFEGTFDGKENVIRNIYQNVSGGETALFKWANKEIKNISLTGTIINTWHAAGICAGGGNLKITNCKNYANVTGYNMVGGISAYSVSKFTISNCNNYGTINMTGNAWQYSGAGGIIGYISQESVIQNCVNEGAVIGNYTRAGIIGSSNSVNIINCINKGKTASGIIGWAWGTISIINCYNIGECTNGIVDSFRGASWDSTLILNIKNCYNLGKVTNSGIVGEQGSYCNSITLNIENCYNSGTSDKAILGKISKYSRTTTITNISNTYYNINKSQTVGAISEGITSMQDKEMKNSETFVGILNNNIGDNVRMETLENWRKWLSNI